MDMELMDMESIARTVWDFLRVDDSPKPSDLILVPCSNDLRIVDHVADLYSEGYTDTILFSGGVAHTDDLLSTGWEKPEAVVFKNEAMEHGIPEHAILAEERATNTGENIRYSKKVVKEEMPGVDDVLLVQKPFSEKRVLATCRNYWQEIHATVAPSPIRFEEYPTEHISETVMINLLVGEVQRLREYPSRGYTQRVEIPDEVWHATLHLAANGYDEHLIEPLPEP